MNKTGKMAEDVGNKKRPHKQRPFLFHQKQNVLSACPKSPIFSQLK
jgi:hypothetical protein